MQLNRQSGFTLIELMVSLAVLAIFATLAAPSFSNLIEKSRLRGATDDVVNLLNTARANAVKLQRDVNVSVSGTSTWCAGAASAADPANPGDPVPAATACDCTATTATCLVDGNKALVNSATYSGVTIGSVSANMAGGITFNSKLGALDLGNLPANPLMVVTSKTGKYATQISVSPLGQTTVCVPTTSPPVSGYPSC